MKLKSLFAALLAALAFAFAGCAAQENYIQKAAEGLTSYEIEARFDDKQKTLFAKQTVDYLNAGGTTLKEVKFHLYPNAFREDAAIKPVAKQDFSNAYPNGASFGKIDIKSVAVEGQKAEFCIDGADKNLLSVTVPQLENGQRTKIEIEFVDLLPNAAHRYGYTDNNVSFGNWYPVACAYRNGWVTYPYHSNGDPFFSDMANFDVTVTFDNKFSAAATGDFSVTRGATSKLTSTAAAVRDFAFVLSDKFSVTTAKAGDVVVQYFCFDDDDAKGSLQTAVDAVNTFNDMIGTYPYKNLCVVQTDFVYGGMEYPNLVYVASGLDAPSQKQTIVHEVAHQWWYNLVGNDQVAHAWMDEGLAEFSTALFFKKNVQYAPVVDYAKLIKTAEHSYIMFTDVMASLGNTDTSMTRASNQYATEQEYVCMTYTKGLLMFENMMFAIGQNKAEKCLKRYFEDFKCKTATPDDLVNSFCKASGVDLKGFFAEWLNGKVKINDLN